MRLGNSLLLLVALLVLGGAFWLGMRDPDAALPEQPSAEDARGGARDEQGEGLRGDAPSAPRARDGRAERQQVKSPSTAPGAKIAVSGRLIHADDRPAAGVDLRYTEEQRLEDLVARPRSLLPALRQDLKTDAGGGFRFEAEPGTAGHLALVDSELVFEGRSRWLPVPAAEADLELGDIRLTRGAVVAGHVRDESTRPLGGVEVTLSSGSAPGISPGISTRISAGGEVRQRAETDEQGAFSFDGLAAGEHTVVTASPRHRPGTATVKLAAGERRDDVVLTLRSGGSIVGVVLDDLRRPVRGATVGAFRKREVGTAVTMRSLSEGESTQTEVDGRFELGGIDDEVVTLRARAEGHKNASVANVSPGRRDVVLVMSRCGSVQGVLVDKSQTAIAGSRVVARAQHIGGFLPRDLGEGETDDEGRFHIEGVDPGLVLLVAEGVEHVPAKLDVTVHPGATTGGVRLVAARGASLTALVVGPDGEPVPGAEVVIAEWREPEAAGGRRTIRARAGRWSKKKAGEDHVVDHDAPRVLATERTGADGVARFNGLSDGRVTVRASHTKLAAAAPENLDVPAQGRVDTTLVLHPAGAVALLAQDADRVALGGAKVEVEGPLGEASTVQTVDVDAQGKAEVAPLATGKYSAALKVPARPLQLGGAAVIMDTGGGVYDKSRVSFTVEAGETAEVVLVRPVLTTFSGTLFDADGPVVGGRVDVELERENHRLELPGTGQGASTDERGAFRIEGLAAGRYTLVYGRKGQVVRMREPLELRGQRTVERQLMLTGGVVKVTVRSARDGEPLRRAKVSVLRGGGAEGGGAPRPRAVAFLALGKGGSGSEQTMQFGGAPPAVSTDEEGVATVSDVPPGKYVVSVEHARHVTHTAEDVEVVAAQSRDLGEVELAVGGQVRGRVVDADGGAPVVSAVELQRRDGEGDPREATAMQGGFRFNGLEPGWYRVRARAMGPTRQPWSEFVDVEVRASKTSSVTAELPKQKR